jgi:zinc transporter
LIAQTPDIAPSQITGVDFDPSMRGDGFGIVPALIWTFRIHDDGSAEPLPVDEPIDHRHDGWLWLHLNLADGRAIEWLRTADLPAAGLALLLGRDKHQQLHTTESCTYGVFADFVRQIGGPADDIAQLRFVMTERLLISGRHRKVNSAESARQALERGECRLTRVAGLVELIVEHAADGIDRLTAELAEELDEIEDGLSLNVTPRERQRIGRIRRTSVRIHRQVAGLCTLFGRLERSGVEGLSVQLRISTGTLAQYLDSLDHDVVEIRDRAQALQEEVTFAVAEETNRHLHLLAVVTTLFLPPTLVTGVFGMNTRGLPFAETEAGFLGAVVLMLLSAVGVYLVLRALGVLKRAS